MTKSTHIVLLFLFASSCTLFSQTRAKTKEPIYFYAGDTCPFKFDHPEKEFGFRIECVGCSLTKKQWATNKRTVAVLDKKYGKGWTLKTIEKLSNEVFRDTIPQRTKAPPK